MHIVNIIVYYAVSLFLLWTMDLKLSEVPELSGKVKLTLSYAHTNRGVT